MSKEYRSDAMASIHETMKARHRVGVIDKRTMRRFDVPDAGQVPEAEAN
jgi:putative transcriptional regulator